MKLRYDWRFGGRTPQRVYFGEEHVGWIVANCSHHSFKWAHEINTQPLHSLLWNNPGLPKDLIHNKETYNDVVAHIEAAFTPDIITSIISAIQHHSKTRLKG